jgi:hypothetical protein
MQVQACSWARDSDPRRAPDAHQRRPAAPPASTTSPPNSTWYHAEAGYKEWGCCLHFARFLLAPSFYKRNTLQSGGRIHAHGMVGLLLCSFIAQQCSVLASFSLTVLFIARATPWADGEVMTCHHAVPGPADMCTIKGDDFITLSRDALIASAPMMPEPYHIVTDCSNPLDSWAVCHFLGGKEILDHC